VYYVYNQSNVNWIAYPDKVLEQEYTIWAIKKSWGYSDIDWIYF